MRSKGMTRYSKCHEMVGVPEVQFRKNWQSRDSKAESTRGKGILVFDSYVVATPVVDTWSQGMIILFHEEETSTNWRGGMCYAGCEGLLNVFLHGLLFRV